MRRKAVAFLQNAWSPVYAGTVWPRRSWLYALHACRSGKRLVVLTRSAPDVDFWFDNTTPIVGATAASVVPPDRGHIKRVLLTQAPQMVVALGKQASLALSHPSSRRALPLLVLPHPACMFLTNELYEQAGELLNQGFTGVLELMQKRDGIEIHETYPHDEILRAHTGIP